MVGARDPKNGAEHSWRTALIATIKAKPGDAGPTRPAYLTVRHDTQESRTGNVNHLGKKYARAGEPQDVIADRTAGMPGVLASAVRELVAECEAEESPEAVRARDADKRECLLRGMEYQAQDYENAWWWMGDSRRRLINPAANRPADELLAQDIPDWSRPPLGEDKR
ncbi:HD domain-containing protein [Streptomyces sp. NPDC015501]|uniref:HD domain-containing protein n=1 Tax=unclassified Streptomyces TaxID=2593676 RepID=UPI0011A2EF27